MLGSSPRRLLPLLHHHHTYMQSCSSSCGGASSFDSNNGKTFHRLSFERYDRSQLQDHVADRMNGFRKGIDVHSATEQIFLTLLLLHVRTLVASLNRFGRGGEGGSWSSIHAYRACLAIKPITRASGDPQGSLFK